MSTQPVDYAALAEQARQQAAPKVDYAALAEQARQGGSAPAPKLSLYEQARQSFEKQKNLPVDQRTESGLQNSFEGHPENIGQYPVATVGRAAEGAVDISRGNLAMGAHKLVQAGMNTLAPMTPIMVAGAPVTAARAIAGGYLGSKATGAIADAAGASPDQKALAEDAGNIVGGGAAATGALRAFLQSPAKAALNKVATAADGLVSDDVLGMISPRALHGLKLLRAANKIAVGAEDSGLAAIADKHTKAITSLESQLNDALSKANALPPEGPTATLKDVPDLRVQPSQQAPQNLLAQRKAAFQAAQQKGVQGEFQVNPPEGAAQGPTAVIRNVQGQPVAASPSAPQGVNPTVLKATGQAPATGGKLTPNMEIYNEPDVAPKPLPKPTLLEQLREWDGIRKIHAQLEDQIGKGQDELQQWIADHNQQAPGGKSTSAAATAKARFQAQRAAAEAKANAIETDPVTNNASGESSASQEAINRVSSEKAQKISRVRIDTRSGNEMPLIGVDAVDAKAGPYDVIMQRGPKGSVILDQGAKARPMPSTPQTDEEMESLLMKSVQAAKAKKARAQAAGD